MARRAVLAVMALVVLSPAALALRVSVVEPPDPFIGYTSERLGFVAQAFNDEGADVTDLCKWTWYFSDGVKVQGNPVTHAFVKAGEYTVTAGAQLKGDSDAASIKGVITDPPGGAAPDAGEQVRMYPRLQDRTPIAEGGTVCDACDVVVETRQPTFLLTMWRKVHTEQQWTQVPFQLEGQFQEGGATWNRYAAAWSSFFDKNWAIDWKAIYRTPPAPPGPTGYIEKTWTPFNTVVPGSDDVLLYEPEDPNLSHPLIGWTIEHYDWRPTWQVMVAVRDLASGETIRTITTMAGLGDGSVEWDGSLDGGGQAGKGVYTYLVHAQHLWLEPPPPWCADSDKVGTPQITVTGVTHSLDVPSLTLTLTVNWQVGGAVDDCRIAVFGPKGLAKKAVHSIGDDGHFSGAASGTETFNLQLDPDEFGTFYAVIYAEETPAAGQNNRDLQPKPILQRGGTTTLWPRAVCTVGDGFIFPGNIYGISSRLAEVDDQTDTQYVSEVVAADAGSLLLQEMPRAGVVYVFSHADQDHLALGGTYPPAPNGIYGSGADEPQINWYAIEARPDGHLQRCLFVFFDGCNTYNASLRAHSLAKGSDTYAGYGEIVPEGPCWTFADEFWHRMMGEAASVDIAYNAAWWHTYYTWGPLADAIQSFDCSDWTKAVKRAGYGQ